MGPVFILRPLYSRTRADRTRAPARFTRHIACFSIRSQNDLPPQRGFAIMADDLGTDGLENQAKGAAKEVGGKLRNAAGGLTGDTSEQIKGKAREVEGKAQRKLGEKEVDADT
jgi:uncharacterized protein YjbJ (UPF0337 family)